MNCPRCKCEDVYVSRSGSSGSILSLFVTTVRCHRCCNLFSVPAWTKVPKKPVEKPGQRDIEQRRAA